MNQRSAIRFSTIVFAALAVNLVMFTIIEYMVGNRRVRLTETTDFDISNFIRVTEQEQDVRSRRDPRAPQKPANEMQQDLDRLSNVAKSGGISGLDVSMPDIELSVDVGGTIQLARELTPLVRTHPEYPVSALVDSIEGYVIVRFTVTETGSVADPEILRSQPPGVFDRSAMRAVLKWKYQPQIVDGKPAAVVTYTRLRFEMEKEE